MWLLNAAIFFVLFAFALNNQEPIILRLFFGAQWQAPLVLIMLLTLLLGVVLGVIVMLPLWLRARKARIHKSDPSTSTLLENDSTLQHDARDIRHGL
jgi:putative membrane protein